MTPISKVIVISTCTILCSSTSAFALTAVKALEGYKCLRVHIPEEKRFDPSALPPVFEAPTEASKLIGHNGTAAFVKWPLNEVDGFVEIIWGQKGVRGWIRKSILRPWRTKRTPHGPASECVPSIMSDGTIGIGNALPLAK